MIENLDQTSKFYSQNAREYADKGIREDNPWLARFISEFPLGAKVLELGCGAGRESAQMLACGLDVTATDGSKELAEIAAQRIGRDVAVLRFEDLDYDRAFDGVFANACLLHVPRSQLLAILQRVSKSLISGGLFYSSFKAGEAEGYDALGRFYNYPTSQWLIEQFNAAHDWESVELLSHDGSGFDGLPTRWLHVFARKKFEDRFRP